MSERLISTKTEHIIYAGESHRRYAFLKHAFPDVEVVSIPAGEEPEISDVISIAEGKINNVRVRLSNQDQNIFEKPHVLIAADSRTCTIAPGIIGNIHYVSRGKPKDDLEVREAFHWMARVNTEHARYYRVNTGSSISGNDISPLSSGEVCAVELSTGVIADLATHDGFGEYLEVFRAFYSEPPYSTNGLPVIDPTDISGGISLPVLCKLRAVKSINGIRSIDSDFPLVLQKALFDVAVGINPEIFQDYASDMHQRIDCWSWLQEVTEKSLESNILSNHHGSYVPIVTTL